MVSDVLDRAPHDGDMCEALSYRELAEGGSPPTVAARSSLANGIPTKCAGDALRRYCSVYLEQPLSSVRGVSSASVAVESSALSLGERGVVLFSSLGGGAGTAG